MEQIEKSRKYLRFSVLALLISCITVWFTGVAADISLNKGNNVPLYLVGGIFWLGLALTYVFIGKSAACVKRISEKKDKRPGIICFFCNREAKIMDIIMIISIFSITLELIFETESSILILGSIFCTLFSVHMHAILNGNTYRYLKTCEDNGDN